jgi:hypothetical protein
MTKQSLHCDAEDCLHNVKEKCAANIIQVNGGATNKGEDTYCNSYINVHDDFDGQNAWSGSTLGKSVLDTEFGNDMAAQTEAPKITCTAGKCEYNHRYYCHANKVDIESPKEDGSMRCECRTFRPK